MFLFGLRFKDTEECLKAMGLPTEKREEPPAKKGRLDDHPPVVERQDTSLPSISSVPSVFLQSDRRHPPSETPSNRDLLDELLGPETDPPAREQRAETPPPPLSREAMKHISGFKPVRDAIKDHFPDVKFPPLRQPKPAMGFEETLRSGNREDIMALAESSLLPTYRRLQEILKSLDQKIVEATERGQGSLSHLRTCRPMYCVCNDSYFSSSAPLNEDYKKLVPHPKASKTSIYLPMEEFQRLEKVLQSLQATQSFTGWMLDVLAKEIRRTDFQPADPDLFNSINKFLGSSMVESMTLSSSLFAFLRLRRREHFAKDFPPTLSESQRKALLSSSLALEKLYDNDLLLSLAEKTSTEASQSANREMAKAIPKLTSAMCSASSSRKSSKPTYQPSSFRKDKRTSSASSSRRDRGSSSKSEHNQPSRPQGQSRGASGRGRASFRGSSRSNRGSFRDKPRTSKPHFPK